VILDTEAAFAQLRQYDRAHRAALLPTNSSLNYQSR
jgi:hypothetical protein